VDRNREFLDERLDAIRALASDDKLRTASLEWMIRADSHKYSYNFSWLGRPIIRYPNDIVVFQEVVWRSQPDLIIETGVAHGGSLVLSASLLELLNQDGRVVGIDIDIRPHNREAIEAHPLSRRITLIEGSSTDAEVVRQVKAIASKYRRVMVVLDSLHTHEHVIAELRTYSEFVSDGCYLILPDTFIEYFPPGYFSNRPWDVGNNPMTALRQFLAESRDFEIDELMSSKALISEAPDGYLIRVSRPSK